MLPIVFIISFIATILTPLLFASQKHTIPNSCLNYHNDDREIWVKPIDGDDYPVVRTKCSNEYMIIDIGNDDNWKDYFSSNRQFHYAVMGPLRDDHVNWDEWFVPDTNKYIISPDCTTCDEDHTLNSAYGTKSSYYMTPVMQGCTQLPIGRIGCDMDFFTYECRVCGTKKNRVQGYWTSKVVYNGLNDDTATLYDFNEVNDQTYWKHGLCAFTVRDATAYHNMHYDTFEECKNVTHQDLRSEKIMPRRKPTIGMDGRFCMCAKGDTFEEYEIELSDQEVETLKAAKYSNAKYRTIKTNEQHVLRKEKQKLAEPGYVSITDNGDTESTDDSDDSSNTITYLYNEDFVTGTYRILASGTYMVMEDLVFDFRAPDGYGDGNLDTYNSGTDWWPWDEDADMYPGTNDKKNAYFLGFYAGITIECDDVILDLNGHELAMTEAFYNQQPFFALITLTSQYFMPGQGTGFFGADPQAATNTVIRNGILGLSSHHGIQGNLNSHITIENMRIYDFKTHGIQLNGFHDITIKNVDVGPNRYVDRLTPWYAHMRALLPTFRKMAAEETAKDVCARFWGRSWETCTTMSDLVIDVQLLMDMAFEHVMGFKDWDSHVVETDADMRKMQIWAENRNVLVNDHIYPPTATLYGIFLNYMGSNVIGWYAGADPAKSNTAYLENIKVHDLYHDTLENIAFSRGKWAGKQRVLNCLNAPFNAFHVFGESQVEKIQYCNNPYQTRPTDEQCDVDTFDLTYVGNKIVDIQIFALKLINDGLSWNYCSAGAADVMHLVRFAFENVQFNDYTPLLAGSHDAMIHPGKGIIGMRLNGIDNVNIKNVLITDIHSATPIGSKYPGQYTGVVSQQLPYMHGFSMNMVQGFTATFSKDVVIEDLKIDNMVSDTGLVYGVSFWYETVVDIVGGGLTVQNIVAGQNLPLRTDEYDESSDELPNEKPEACGVRLHGDETFSAEISYSMKAKQSSDGQLLTNVNIMCINGHTGCDGDNVYTNLGTIGDCTVSDDDDHDQTSWNLLQGDDDIPDFQFLKNLMTSKGFGGGYIWYVMIGIFVAVFVMIAIFTCLKLKNCKKYDDALTQSLINTNHKKPLYGTINF